MRLLPRTHLPNLATCYKSTKPGSTRLEYQRKVSSECLTTSPQQAPGRRTSGARPVLSVRYLGASDSRDPLPAYSSLRRFSAKGAHRYPLGADKLRPVLERDSLALRILVQLFLARFPTRSKLVGNLLMGARHLRPHRRCWWTLAGPQLMGESVRLADISGPRAISNLRHLFDTAVEC